MRNATCPFVLPAICVFTGAWLALELGPLPVGCLLGLVALGLAFGRAPGWVLTFLSTGALLPVLHGHRPELEARLIAGAPAEVRGGVSGHGREVGDSKAFPLAVERIVQRGRVLRLRLPLWVSLSDGSPAPGLGDTVVLRGILNRSDGYFNKVRSPPGPWRLQVKSDRLWSVWRRAGPLGSASAWLRARVETEWRRVDRSTPGTAMARALVLGDARALPEGWQRGLRIWGLSHLLSVSGLHLSLVAGFVAVLLFVFPKRVRLAGASLALLAYVLILGPIPAVIRSAVMAWLAIAAWLLERPPTAANAWGVAMLGMLVVNPYLVADLGFQLTLSATAGLIFVAPRLVIAWTRLPRFLVGPLAASVAAQLCTLPWSLPHFHLLTPLAPLANLVAVPWCGLILIADLSWALLLLIHPDWAMASIPVLDILLAPFIWWLELPPEWAQPQPLLGSFGLGCLIATIFLAVFLRPRSGRLLLLGVGLLAGSFWPNSLAGTEVVFLDVGQGDAILMRSGRHALLVDGGGWSRGDFGNRVLLPALLAEGVRRLDHVVLSHADSDHCRGLADLVGLISIHDVWMTDSAEHEPCGAQLSRAYSRPIRRARRGEVLQLGSIRLEMLHPDAGEGWKGNDGSVVVRAELGSTKLLLTGDIEAAAEQSLVASYGDRLGAEVLKVAHHGSKSSSSRRFVSAVKPRWAIVSAGRENRYGHPATEVVERLEGLGVRVLRTDRDGLIRWHPGISAPEVTRETVSDTRRLD